MTKVAVESPDSGFTNSKVALRVSIKYKLLSVLLGIGAVAVIITGLLGYEAGKRGLTQTAMNQLTGIRRSKAHQIEAYFRGIRSQVRTLRESRMAIEALRKFRTEFRQLDGAESSPEIRSLIAGYYKTEYLPRLEKLVKPRVKFDEYLPVGQGAYSLQAAFVVKNSFPIGKKKGTGCFGRSAGLQSRTCVIPSILP